VKICVDTSVIVAALVDQLPNHQAALAAMVMYTTSPHEAVCSTHTLAECYSVLTALPLARRVTPADAQRIVSESVASRLSVVDLLRADYLEAISLIGQRGLSSGAVYDALHIVAAMKSSCERILTYKFRHFQPLVPEYVTVVTP
jgi:predicted nucleic acid-binding protein